LAEAREVLLTRERTAGVTYSDQDDPATLRRRLDAMVGELNRALEREAILHSELEEVRQHRDRARQALQDITSSPSWRLTEPLRMAKRRTRTR
jgi:hypothetical protein